MVQCLKCCIINILDTASYIGATSIAIPSISTGTYGFPPDINGYITVQCVLEWCMACDVRGLTKIKLCNFDPKFHDSFVQAFYNLNQKY
jgi:O-acetyl-ADP-ribose deacetylase (regulator of RNase III)